ncbi:MAG: carbohydrate kinase family protein [Candidatus Saccharimonadales bacterium]
MSQIDILCVGDVVTDVFIKLLDDKAEVHKDRGQDWLCIPFGTKLPFDHTEILHAVGNAANAAVSCARLGLKVAFETNVGGDQEAREIIHQLSREKVDHRFVHINPKKLSNMHYVLWYKEERTILIKHEEYEYNWPHFRPAEIPRWVYFSSISENALDYSDEISTWLEKHPEVKLAFQPGTFQMEAGVERLKRLYARTEVIILNREEAVDVTGGSYDNVHDLLDRLHSYGCKIAVVTDGPSGAYASDGQNRYKMPLYPDPAPPYERTGAGDAYASTLVAALAQGHNLESALQWAPINSMSVVQKTGAQTGLLSQSELEAWLRKAPDWYHVESF